MYFRDRCWKRRKATTGSLFNSSLSAVLKKLLAHTPNFRMQANTSRLSTSYSAHLFATRKLFLQYALRTSSGGGFFRLIEEVIALISKIGVKSILKIYPIQVAIFNWNFSVYLWVRTVIDVENLINTECKMSYNKQQNEYL